MSFGDKLKFAKELATRPKTGMLVAHLAAIPEGVLSSQRQALAADLEKMALADPKLLDRLEAGLKADPNLSKTIVAHATHAPEGLRKAIVGFQADKNANLSGLLPELPANVAAGASVGSSRSEEKQLAHKYPHIMGMTNQLASLQPSPERDQAVNSMLAFVRDPSKAEQASALNAFLGEKTVNLDTGKLDGKSRTAADTIADLGFRDPKLLTGNLLPSLLSPRSKEGYGDNYKSIFSRGLLTLNEKTPHETPFHYMVATDLDTFRKHGDFRNFEEVLRNNKELSASAVNKETLQKFANNTGQIAKTDPTVFAGLSFLIQNDGDSAGELIQKLSTGSVAEVRAALDTHINPHIGAYTAYQTIQVTARLEQDEDFKELIQKLETNELTKGKIDILMKDGDSSLAAQVKKMKFLQGLETLNTNNPDAFDELGNMLDKAGKENTGEFSTIMETFIENPTAGYNKAREGVRALAAKRTMEEMGSKMGFDFGGAGGFMGMIMGLMKSLGGMLKGIMSHFTDMGEAVKTRQAHHMEELGASVNYGSAIGASNSGFEMVFSAFGGKDGIGSIFDMGIGAQRTTEQTVQVQPQKPEDIKLWANPDPARPS